MFKSTLIFSILFLSSAFAAKPIYNVDMNLSLKGQKVSSPKMKIAAGEKATFEQTSNTGHGNFIEITATELLADAKKTQLNLVVGRIKQGKREILSTPQMIVVNGQEATFTVGDNKGSEDVSLTVLTQRQK